jgi:transcriptional regulator with XRE-family HTH domain
MKGGGILKDTSFGTRLKTLRKEKKLRQTEAAPLIGVSYSSLQNHEAGRLPSRTTLKKYLDFYGCDRDWLMTGKGDPFPEKTRKSHKSFGRSASSLSEAQRRMEKDGGDPLIDAIAIVKDIMDYGDAGIISTLMSGLTAFQKVVQLGREAESLMAAAKQLGREPENDEHGVSRAVSQAPL